MPTSLQPVMTRRRVIALGAALAASLPAGIGFARQATPESATTTSESTFLDPSVIHDIAASFSQDDYDAMIQAYIDTGDKEWIEATITIDGSTYEQAGMRLKGNSSLMGLRGGQGGGPGGNGGGMGGSSLSADEPQGLPWLVRLDKYVDGQNHDGITELVIRSNNSATALNEAVALDLLALAGLASQQAAYIRFTVNESEPALRLAIENPNDAWMERHFPAGGLLYKAEAGGDYSYRGDDADSYVDVFDLEAGDTGDDQADFAPLAAFLQFINESDDATFKAELANHLDIDGLATYLAMMDLLGNFDDIDGPGNNSYLHVDPGSEVFVVVPWDMNLAFGGIGGGQGGGTFTRQFPEDSDGATPEAGQFPPPEGFEIDGTPAAGDEFMPPQGGNNRQDGFMQGGPGGSNILVQRWNAIVALTELVTNATIRLRTDLYESGAATEVLDRWTAVLTDQATDIIDASTIESESSQIAEFFTAQ